MLRLYNLQLSLDDGPEALGREAARRLGLPAADLRVALVKRGVDARDKRPRYNCTADVTLPEGVDAAALLARLGVNAAIPDDVPPLSVTPGPELLRGRVVVVGSGPAGAFAALALAQNGYRPLVLERGRSAPERLRQIGRFNARVVALDPENNTLFGEGGAGSFSDGKLYTSNRDPLLPRVLEALVECGAPAHILTDAAPHVGTDVLSRVVVALRRRIESLGGEFRFSARMTDLQPAPLAVVVNGTERIEAGAVVLAPGHSARDTYAMLLHRGVALQAKPFQLGVRIEHPQELVDRAQLGRFAKDPRLAPAAYDLAVQPRGAPALFSFCMCPGGITMNSVSEPGLLCTNGMSFSPRASRYANSALVTTFEPADYAATGSPLDGIEFQRRHEKLAFEAGGGDYTCPAQPVTHFLRGLLSPRVLRGTYALGRRYAERRAILPAKLNAALQAGLPLFERRLKGFVSDAGVLHAVESRASSPVRIARNADTRESENTTGLYPCGEGAGYAGGIMSAALDGLRSALAIVARFAQPR
ncbi:MAG: FAD-dependent oxidoreductase [Planctomycetes bacterium]|nr:FAD-dependent oxidoreductase [Planctomycetota bacterium]